MNFKLGVSNQNQNFHYIHAFFIGNMRPAFCKSHLKSEKYFQPLQNDVR